MVEYSEEFGQRVGQYLAQKRLTPAAVENRSQRRVSHMTIRRMMQGHCVNSDSIVEVADALGERDDERERIADDLLQLAGKRVRYARVRHGCGGWREASAAAA